MPTPRENTSTVKAPVLFRLPHLQHAPAANRSAANDGGTNRGFVNHGCQGNWGGDPFTDRQLFAATHPDATANKLVSSSVGDTPKYAPTTNAGVTGSPTLTTTAPSPTKTDPGTANESTFLSRWGIDLKRSVILLAAVALLWGAWAVGQKRAGEVDESSIAKSSESASSPVPEAVTATGRSGEPQVARIAEPARTASTNFPSDFRPVTEPRPADGGRLADLAVTNNSTSGQSAVVNSDFSQLSLDSLEPPSESDFYGDDDLGEPAQSFAQKPPLTTDAATPNQLVLNEPVFSLASQPALPSVTNFVPSATPEMPGFDPKTIDNSSGVAPTDNRPVFSSTPNAIIDWSRYLPGASGSGSIRSVSATQAISGAAGEAQSADTQAIYLDKNDPNSPGVGVAPYYR